LVAAVMHQLKMVEQVRILDRVWFPGRTLCGREMNFEMNWDFVFFLSFCRERGKDNGFSYLLFINLNVSLL
jgi:hypothetical protein